MGLRTTTVQGDDDRARRPSWVGARGLSAAFFFLLAAAMPRLSAATAGRVALPGSVRAVPMQPAPTGLQPNVAGAHAPGITRMNLLPQEMNATMSFNIGLKMRNFAELEARLGQGETISPSEMAARYWPLAADYAATADWLRQQGFTLGADSGGSVIFASGTVAQVRDAFQVSFARVASEGEEFTSAISTPSMPAELVPALVGVNGLQPHLRKHSHLRHPDSTTTPFVTPYIPSDLLQAYGASGLTQTGAGQTIAIVMSGYPSTSDLTQFWSACNISQTLGNYTTVSVNGGPASGRGSADVEEATLDVEWSSSIAPAAKIRLYGTPALDNADLDSAYQQIYTDATNNNLQLSLHVVSLSYGGSEIGSTTSQLQTDDQLFAQLASAGITVFASSGDDGSTPGGTLTPESPSTDPNVTAVGGTSITLNTTTGAVSSETVWNDGSTSATGGGQSAVFTRPVWQTGTGAMGSASNRMVPDVAAPADPQTGCLIILNGNHITIGGTSWGAPTWAGFATLINQARAANHTATLGLLGPKIYPLIGASSFFDITVGNNTPNSSSKNYFAGIGFDMCTGVGRPVFPDLLNQLTTVLLPPKSVTVAPGQNALFSPITTGATSFQWQRLAASTSTWANLTDGGAYSGSATAVLTVSAATLAMSGDQFQCIVNGNITTPAVTLEVVDTVFAVSTFAGQAGVAGTANGAGTAAQFDAPNEMAFDSGGNMFVADFLNNSIREITPVGNVTTFAGSPAGAAGFTNAIGTAALFNGTNAVVVGAGGNIYVADSSNNAIRRITPAGNVTTFAGSTRGTSGFVNSSGTNARFNFPEGVAVDSGGNIYVADTFNNAIRKITSAGNVTTLAGSTSGTAGFADGNGTSATFNFPSEVVVDSAKNVYVADSNNNAIRKITPGGVVTTLAGHSPYQGVADGTGASARFNFPSGITIDSGGNLYVADTNNNAIRKVTPAGVVTTLVGDPAVAGSADGVGFAARFNQPYGLAVDATGNLYIADTYNDTIRQTQLAVAPSIQAQPVNTTVLDGNAGGFNVTATGVPAPNYQWQVFPSGGTAWANLTDNATYNGSATANLTINTTSDLDGAQFRVIVSNGAGSVTSSPATLTIQGQESPIFTAQPTDETVTAGGPVTFSLGEQGLPAPTVQWQVLFSGGSVWANLTDNTTYHGSTTANLTINATTTAMNGNQFRAVLSNNLGNLTSNIVTLTVQAPPAFTTQPVNQSYDLNPQQILVANSNSGVIGEYTTTGLTLNSTLITGLSFPQMIAESGTSLFVVNYNNNTIGEYTTTGATINATLIAGLNEPDGIAIFGTTIYVVNRGNGTIGEYSTTGEAINATLISGLNNPAAITTDGTNLFISNFGSNTICEYTTSGVLVNSTLIAGLSQPYGLAVSGTNLFVANNGNGTIGEYTTSGATENATLVSGLSQPFALVVSGSNLFVTNNNQASIGEYTTAGGTVNAALVSNLSGNGGTTGLAVSPPGNMVSFSVAVTGLPAPTLQWQREASGTSVWTNLTDNATYNGSTTATLTINAATSAMNGDQFQCVASNVLANVTSNTATLLLETAAAITQQPGNLTVLAGNSASFGVVATGVPAPTYQWQRLPSGGSTWANLTDDATYNGSATANLTINATTLAMSGDEFQVFVSNPFGNATSNAATLNIEQAPTFIAQPSDDILAAGGQASFSVTVGGVPAPTIQWQTLPAGGSVWANLTDNATYNGSATATLTINNTTSAMNGAEFRAVISNIVSSATSATANLTVQSAPVISASPVNATAPAGSSATFGVAASGVPAPSYQWQRFPSGGSAWANLTDNATYNGSATANLTVNATTSAMNGDQFRAIVSNLLGSAATGAATLTVQSPPTFTLQPANTTVAVNANATFTVAASGTPAPTFQWQRLASGGTVWSNLTSTRTYRGTTTTTLTVNSTTTVMNGDEFRCVAGNTFGNTTSNIAILTVQSPPTFTTPPANTTVVVGGNAALGLVASGVPAPTVQWQFLASGNVWANLTDNATYNGSATANLTINATTTAMNGGQFRAVLSNLLGNVTSGAVVLTVQSPASFTLQPTAQLYNAGDTVGFAVAVNGVPTPTLQWQRLPSGGSVWANLTDGATYNGSATAALTINAATTAMNGDQFQCVASNVVGNVTSNAVAMLLKTPPVFGTQPGSVVQSAGGSATFTVAATGQPNTITYQWQLLAPGGSTWSNLTDDGVTYAGSNTTTLTVSNLTLAQDGSQFQCVASNGVSPNTTSNAASLSVRPVGYLSWAAALNLAGAQALPEARSFGDTIPNLLRFAMNLGATPAPGDLPGLSTQIVNNTAYLTLQYNQLKSLTGVQLVAQYSYDLVTWQTLGNGAVVQLADVNAQTEQFSASIAIPANGVVFLRLVVVPSP